MANYVIRFPSTSTVVSDILAFVAGLIFGRTILNMFSSVIPGIVSSYANNTLIREILMPALMGPQNGASTEQLLVMVVLSVIIVLLIVKLTKRIAEIVALFLLGMIVHNVVLILSGVDIDYMTLLSIFNNTSVS